MVELDLTARRAAILRLPGTEGIPAYDGLRLLLGAGSGGAEFRLVPWTNADPALSAPGVALEDLTGGPVTLVEGAPGWVGALFGDVRIHTDGPAAEAADELDADDFTVDRDVYFASGKFSPSSGEGRDLIAHELAHTLNTRPFDPNRVDVDVSDPLAP